MKEILVCVGWYYGVSFLIGVGFLIEFLILKIFDNKNEPLLAKDAAKVNAIVFMTGMWFPLLVIKCVKNTFFIGGNE